MRRLRWLILPIGIGMLLLVAAHATLGGAGRAAVHAQSPPELPMPPRATDAAPINSPGTLRGAANTASSTLPPTASSTASPTASTTPSTPTSPTATPPTAATHLTATAALSATATPTYYVVLPGDTLFVIATDFGTTVEALLAANGLSNADLLYVGQVLLIPGPNGELPDPALLPMAVEPARDGGLTGTVLVARGTITERMTSMARQVDPRSPYYGKTWLTYYGRPNVPQMGILGEHTIEELAPRLREEAAAYDRANGDTLTVMPAYHLVYGMATKAAGDDNSHLAFMDDTTVISYIQAAEAEGWSVILDVQIGALEPSASITRALKFLKYPNVHLAIDPEFAMVHPGQSWPGNPIGYVTADQVNRVQALVNAYVQILELPGPRILLVHQFLDTMIVDPENLDTRHYPHVALTLSVDGWGGPWGKISKYNALVTVDSPFTAFKLFYRWDEPLLTPHEALGLRPFRGTDFAIDVTPNLIIYQ